MIYDREHSIAKVVKDSRDAVQDVKSLQIVGNDNLIAYWYEIFDSDAPVAGVHRYRARFTFDEPPVESFVQLFLAAPSLAIQYRYQLQADPSDINSLDTQSVVLHIQFLVDQGTIFFQPQAISTSTGTLTFSKLP